MASSPLIRLLSLLSLSTIVMVMLTDDGDDFDLIPIGSSFNIFVGSSVLYECVCVALGVLGYCTVVGPIVGALSLFGWAHNVQAVWVESSAWAPPNVPRHPHRGVHGEHSLR